MIEIRLAVVCIVAVTNLIEGTTLPHGARRDKKSARSEKVHDKVAYIAAIIDDEHMAFMEGLRSTSKPHDLSEAAIERLVTQHMTNVTKTILPDLESLISMSNDLDQSASEVNVHFAEDHVEAILQAVYGEESNQPKFYKSLRQRIAAHAQTQIRLVFQHKNEKI